MEVFVSTDFELPSLDPEPVPSLVPNLELDESLLTPSSLPQEARKDGNVDQCKSSSPSIDKHPGPVLEVGSLRKVIEQVSEHTIDALPDVLEHSVDVLVVSHTSCRTYLIDWIRSR